MLVKALRLRYMGHRIPTDVLRQEQPMTGELTYSVHLHGRTMTAMLMPLGGSTEPVLQLYACKIKIERRGILIRGEEDHWKRKNRETYPQTVWAWPVPAETMITVQPPPDYREMQDLLRRCDDHRINIDTP